MATRIRTLNFLPEVFKTPSNAQFLAASLDQIVAQPAIKTIQGYVGSKFGYGINAKDYYVTEPTKTRTDYQLAPGVVFTKPNESVAQDFISYPGILDALKLEGALTENNSRLFNSQFYSWDSFTDLDKIINYHQYYWIPEGPERVIISAETVFSSNDYLVTDVVNGYNIVPITSTEAGSTNPTLTLLRGGTYTFAVNQNSQFWIQGEPGVTGFSPTQPNLQTRDVYGVDNNGASMGIVTFTVPNKNVQNEYNFPGNNLVSVVSTLPFSAINGMRLFDLKNIDGVTALNGLTVMFYNTGYPNEIGYVSNFFDYTAYDYNDSLVATKTITVTETASSGDVITCDSTANLVVGNSIVFTGNPFGGLAQYSETLPNTLYYIRSIINDTEFTVSLSIGGPAVTLSDATGTMTGTINQGLLEEGFYTTVNQNFYTIQYLGDPADPVIRLIPAGSIPTEQKITAQFGTQFGTRNFYKNTSGTINIIPFISAPLDTLYYQDGTSSDKVGILKIVDSNITNVLDVEKDILGKKQFTSTTGVVFTNGLKVTFQGAVLPVSYKTGSYYVEGVGTAIELIPVENLIAPDPFTESTYIPWDTLPYDIGNYEGNSYIPVTPDYITIARNSFDRNAWSRSNRWFHIDVINATAEYNQNSNLVTLYATQANKAKRPIIEFYPNLKLFNSGVEGKAPVDFVDIRTTDAFSYVAGQQNYYPDVAVYTDYDSVIAPASAATTTTITIPASSVNGSFEVGQYVADSTNVLPRNSYITDVVETTSTVTLTIEWDFAETFTGTSVASIIATNTTVDNYALFNGSTIIFAADTDLRVRNKIYVSRFSMINGSSAPVITLTEIENGLVLDGQQTVSLRGYYNQAKDFYFNGDHWIEAQEKINVNQPPLFDVFDSNGVSFGNSDLYVGTSFTGNKLFAYGIGSGIDDTILGFPLQYSSVDNVGDISFDISLNADSFNYVDGTTPKTQKVNTGYVHQYLDLENYKRRIGWETAVSPSIQYQIFQFEYDVLNPNKVFTCDVSMISSSFTEWPTIEVYINNKIQPHTNYTATVQPNSTTVTLTTEILSNTIIQILVLSDQTSKTAYYNIPVNLNNNPLNQDITTANLGDIRGQYQSIFYNNPNTVGPAFGPNNYRDLGNLVPWGNRIIQNSASLVLPGTFLRKQEHNLFNALMFNSKEYIKFKTLLVDVVNNSNYVQRYDPATMLDDALDQITATKSSDQSFFWSDMIPSKSAYISNTYSFANSLQQSIYPLSKIYNFTSANYYGVLVYLTRTVNGITYVNQLIKDVDYTVSTTSPSLTVTLPLQPGDKITVKEYNQTYGSYVPNTPTKLGLYPSFIPEVVLDSNYTNPTYFILGHDGSYNKLYGDYNPATGLLVDFRDQVLLEYEKRVYNNLKISATIPVQEYEVLPGFFRETDYSYDEWLEIYGKGFLNWVGQNRLNYQRQLYQTDNQYTYNYWQSGNKINKQPISQGYWRGIYQYYYDTTTPDSTPWEMLGLNNKPDWWETRYGPAPYTSDNLVLWNDLAQGINWNDGHPFVEERAIRPQLLKVLPVDSEGNLVSPFVSIVGNYNSNLFQRDWKIGDLSPVELSYRRSSSYPFDLMRILALTKPAEFFNLGVDLDNYKYNAEFNQYLVNDRSHLDISKIQIYGNGTAKTSYINWIVDFEKQYGIDATTNITTLLNNLDVRLVYRLAGFSDKVMLKFYVEKGTPNSRNASLLIPDESYSVLLYDNQPFNRIVYSGVIVQITADGYSVYGNSQTQAFFKTLKPLYNNEYEKISVEKLSVKIAKSHSDNEQIVPYGTVFYSPQDVAQFLSNYGAYLESQGMVFSQQENELTVNWNQMIAEFLYWSQMGWEVGSIATLNPAAKFMEINKDSNIVQPLTMQQTNFILNQNLYPIQMKDLSIYREGTKFAAQALNDGDTMAYAQYNIGNIEHGIVFDNVTLFNDIIYNLVTGLRQNRIFLRGTKSAEWNGTVDAQGFIYNQDNIVEWNKDIKYTKGSIVKYKNKYWTALKVIQPATTFDQQSEYWKITEYNEIQKGLLPNASTRAYESGMYYDVNKANLETDADQLSFSLIGYRPRDYLALADLTDITQVNVYKNLIKNKGTRNATLAFKGANLPQGGIDYDIYENWAIKAGEFGGLLNSNFIDFKLNEKYLTGNPSIVGLTNGVYNEGVQQEVPIYSLFNYGRPITDVNVLPTISSQEPSTVYPDAGYVNFNDVKMSSYFYSQMPFAVNSKGSLVPISQFYVRDYVWLANYLEKWQVFTPVSLGVISSVKNNLNNTVTVTFASPHNLKPYDPVAIINFSPNVDGYYVAPVIVDTYRILINLTLDPNTNIITGQGIGFGFQSQRVSTPAEIINLPLLNSEFEKNTVWVDENDDGGWAVYRKGINYQYNKEFTRKATAETFGSAVAYTSELQYLIGDSGKGEVYRYVYDELSKDYIVLQTLAHSTSFGSTISYSDDIFVISEPTSVSPKVYIYHLDNTILSKNLTLLQTISAPSGSINWGHALAISGDKNWIYISDYDNTLTPNRVYVYRKSQLTGSYEYATYVTTSGLTTGDRFGYSLSTDYYGDTLIVGTPNQDYSATIDNWGYTYVFDRSVQNFEIQYASDNYIPQTLSLAWTPTTLTKSVSATTSVGNKITLNNVTGLVVDQPIVFTGTLTGTQISPNQVYYIGSIVGSDITVKISRTGSTLILGTVGSLTASAIIQNTTLYVSVNGTLVDDNNYAVINNGLLYVGTLSAGDIVNVSDRTFTLVQTLTSEQTPQVGAQFGTSVDTTTHASEIIIGAPYELNTQVNEGAVYRYTNGGGKYGDVYGTSTVNVTSARSLLINGFAVYVPAGNATAVANAINAAKITNVAATAIDGKLSISLIDKNLAPINEKLLLSAVETVTLQELGINVYTQTQTITCPHPKGHTQFGTVVRFNEFDSFVVSAPVGTRFEATTFDFTDDENQDNDTIFDNNTTTWLDSYPNAGAVYMFDYLSVYNESLLNLGKFVYAQSTNATNIEYGSQPRYGTSIDFNNYGVIVGAPNFLHGSYNGQVVTYTNPSQTKDWSVYRQSAPVVDINKIGNIQIFSAETNNTLINLDYIDPLQGKILGAVRENIDYVSNNDPAVYNNKGVVPGNVAWGAKQLGQIWFNTKNVRYVNYHQNDNTYNSKYWGTLFPNSDVAVYTWISSSVVPANYQGPGTPLDATSYAIEYTVSPSGALQPIYFYWVRNTNSIQIETGKTLSDNVIAFYIQNPKASGISYFAPLLPSVFALYNSGEYINANDSVLNIGFGTGTNDDVTHNQYNLIRAGYADDFLPGVPDKYIGITEPYSLYARMLDSMSGTDRSGAIVPDPYLPRAVQSGILVRPRQSFFLNRFGALKNYFQYANEVIKQIPAIEIIDSTFAYQIGPVNPSTVNNPNWNGPVLPFYNTTDYWETVNWWAPGYTDNTKSTVSVPQYSYLSTLDVPNGTIATVEMNGYGLSETYILTEGVWERIGLKNGTFQFKSSLWDYSSARLGFGDNFFDTAPYDTYPSEETRFLVRGLNEELPSDLLKLRNEGLILLFEYIQAESVENQNYLPWLNKTSLVDVSHTIRELLPLEVFQSDNQNFLAGYINEVKPYHVVIKDFLFKYTGIDVYPGTITDFDLPAQYNANYEEFITPQLVYSNPNNEYQYLPTDTIWQKLEYKQWFENYGVSLTGQSDVQMTTLTSYISLNSNYFSVNNANGFPINGIIKIGTEQIGYSSVDRNLNVLSGLTRGVNGTPIKAHIPGENIFMDLPAVLLLNGGRAYSEPPKVTAYIDTSIYPAPTRPAVLSAVMNLDSVLRIDVIDPGQGYAALPEIIIDPASKINFTSDQVNTLTNTVQLYAPLLQTGDLIQYMVGTNGTVIEGLQDGQWYYINLLETVPTVTVALYDNYTQAIKDEDRILLYGQGTGNQTFNLGAKASAISTAVPVRENNITLKFDRTTYDSQVIDWQAGKYYGAYYAGSYSNSNRVASSSIKLESTQPDITSILASAEGVAFEITNITNNRTIEYSSLIRQIASTQSSNNSITLSLLTPGAVDANASGSTIGFYIGMPIQFKGAVIGGLQNNVTYYVHSVIDETNFTVTTVEGGDPTGSPMTLTNATVTAAGLQCLVGEVTDIAILTVNYPGITYVTATQANTNKLTIPLNSTGSGGTAGFYINLPVFFTGTMIGGIRENQVYYVTTVVDDQTFTMSETENPSTYNIIGTIAGTDAITTDGDTAKLSINEPIIFNTMKIAGSAVTTFGGLVSGTTYYVSKILNGSQFQVSESVNGATFDITSTVSPASNTSALCTSQKNTFTLTTATGSNMIINISLPVSPGQVNGQKFTLYETSSQYPNKSGVADNLISRNITAALGTVNRVAISNKGGLTDFYVNMPVQLSQDIGLLTSGTTYYVISDGLIQVNVTSTSSSTNELTCNSTQSLYIDMPIVFSGQALGGIDLDVEYYVHSIIDSTHFKVTNTPNGSVTTLFTTNGLMVGTGNPYVQLSTTLGGSAASTGNTQQTATISIASPAVITVTTAPANGSKIKFRTTGSLPSGVSTSYTYYVRNRTGTTFNISLTPSGTLITTSGSQSGVHTVIDIDTVDLNQTPLSNPAFDVSYVLGGYRVIITTQGSGYAIDNTITIAGTNMGGTSPKNDLTLTVSAIDSTGAITDVICSGTVPGYSSSYYLKVTSPFTFEVYSNPLMTVPVSGFDLPYVGTTQTTVTYLNSGTEKLTLSDASGFYLNDGVVFTGDMTPTVGVITAGQTYYITSISGNDITISTVPGGTNVNITTSIAANFTIAKFGSFALLPEPFVFNQSIVKYNNRVYVCVVSNYDTEFIFGKWELLQSGDRRLNALDRIAGYYQPTVNMPGLDMTQLLQGVTYPGSTYFGNPFAPAEQYPLDTILTDQPFYPTEVNISSIMYHNGKYISPADTTEYSAIVSSLDTLSWNIQKISNATLNTTDIIYHNGYYLVTTDNPATPIYKSTDGITWSMLGRYVALGTLENKPIQDGLLSLNSIGYYNNTFVAVGKTIVVSSNAYTWVERFKFSNNLNNNLYGVIGTSIPSYSGYVAVGKGQTYRVISGLTNIIDVNIVILSNDGISWNQVNYVSEKGFYGVASNGTRLVAVGEDGVIYTSTNGTNWLGVNESNIVSVNASSNILNVGSTIGFTVNDPVRFTQSFNNISSSTTYYVVNIPSSTQIQVSTTIGGSAITLTVANPSTVTYMYSYPVTGSLLDITYQNGIFMAVGENGLIKTSTDGITWTVRTSNTTENLRGVTYNVDDNLWVVVGDNNTIIDSNDNGATWVSSSIFAPRSTVYNVQGDNFTAGYGPEELVPGVVTDNLTMTVTTRPGTNWSATEYQHVGYNVVSQQYTPINSLQTEYSFEYIVQTPAQIAVFVINGTTGLATRIYEPAYTVDWVNSIITLATPLTYTPISDRLQIDVYEIGNGNQLVKSNTKTDPIRYNEVTGWNEIYLNCNYSATIFAGGGIIIPGSDPKQVIVYKTQDSTNAIFCEDTRDFIINDPITFQGNTFGGLQEDTTYYVKTVSHITNTITVSEFYNTATGTAGATFDVTTATGTMYAIIEIGSGTTYTDPITYLNGSKLVPGITGTVTRTNGVRNTVTCNSTEAMALNMPITFSDTMFGGVLQPQTVYYIHSIYDNNEFRVSATPSGSVIALTTDTGGAEFITNDYAFGIALNGISAKMIFAVGTYNDTVDYLTYTLFGETTPAQYGYTIPETQTFTGDGITVTFNLDNYVSADNPDNAVVEINGLRLLNSTDYTIDAGLQQITFASAPVNNSTIAVTTYNLTDRQYLNSQFGITGKTVANIIAISNSISPPIKTTNVIATDGTTEYITCASTSNMIAGQTVIFKGTSFGGIATDGTVYFIKQVISLTQFTIADQYGAVINLTTDSGLIVAYVGGQPAVRVTTGVSHNLVTNDFVRIDGTTGSVQLNNSTYYVHVINDTQFDLYSQVYDPGYTAVNYPITDVSTYVNGGYVWIDSAYILATTTATSTSNDPITGNRITATTTSNLVVETPVIFTSGSSMLGDTIMGGIVSGTVYYIREIVNITQFTISETRGGDEFVLTNDTGSINVTQWEQTNPDRLYVTINGYRVPSTSLKINPGNYVSILSKIVSGDKVTITSMMPSATPNEEIYMLNVNKYNEASVYRANRQARTWLVAPLYDTDDTIYLRDITSVTNFATQTDVVSAPIDGIFSIGLIADKQTISSISVYNVTKNALIDSSHYEIVIIDSSPMLHITDGSYIDTGDTIYTVAVEGNLIYIDGEQIKFRFADLANNTVTGLQRGANGTITHKFIEENTEVYSVLSANRLTDIEYHNTWNSYTFNTVEGDPLQISTTGTAIFLNQDET